MMRKSNAYLIWLLRSCGKAVNMPNNGFGGLGPCIAQLMRNRFGNECIVERDVPTDWGQLGTNLDKGQFGLPQTSAVYEFPINQWPNVLEELFLIP